MSAQRLSAVLAAALVVVLLSVPGAAASPAPAWSLHSLATPTNFAPEADGPLPESATPFHCQSNWRGCYEVIAQNTGGAATSGEELTLTDTLPAGLTVIDVELPLRESGEMVDKAEEQCETTVVSEVATVLCTIPEELPGSTPALLERSEALRLIIHAGVPAEATGVLTNFVEIEGGGAPPASLVSENPISATAAVSGFQEFRSELVDEEGKEVKQAGSHPYQYSTSFAANTKPTPLGSAAPFVPAGGDIKNIKVELPPGLVGDPTAITSCTPLQFNTSHNVTPGPGSSFTANDCPDSSVLGVIVVQQIEGEGGILPLPLYNLVPPKGMPAQLGFQILGAPFYIDTAVRTGGDYGITASLKNVSEAKRVTAAAVTIWGAPADERHDPLRGSCLNQIEKLPFSMGSCPAGIAVKPFFRLPTSCIEPMSSAMSFDTWPAPGAFVLATDPAPVPTGCEELDFEPTISAVPQVSAADSPSGLSFNLHLPQSEDPDEFATADLRDAVVTLPQGTSVNPSSANGLLGCSPAQIDLNGPGLAQCPDASKVGSVEVKTPLLDHPVNGSVHVATQTANPFGSLIAIYVTANDPESGVVLKLAGKVEPDPLTGRLTTRFTDNPQLPFEDLTVNFFDGPRAPLRTPPRCGTYTTTTSLRPWSAPASGPDASPSDSFTISSGPDGAPCPTGALQPRLSAGLSNPVAGAFSPFTLRLVRDDGSGEFAALEAKLPPGLTANLKGLPYCPETGIAQALGRRAPGQGAVELTSPSCPSASRVGSLLAGAGAGPNPFYTGGELYFAGPYKGAPVSLLAVIPAIAGPFDLGVVATRIALRLNPESAQVSAISDPFPTILSGIPIDVRDIRVNVDRPNFMLAPTNCEPMAVQAIVQGTEGQSAPASDRFQVGNCKALKFVPSLTLRLKGGTKRDANPALRAVLKAKPGQANIANVSVALPHSAFLDNEHIATICTRIQFAAATCPKGSIYGKVRATTPLLEEPLEGPVYLRSSSNLLPDLVAVVRGPARIPIEVAAVGRIDSFNGGIRTSFEAFPDVPVTQVVLSMKGGKKGLLVNSRNICKHTNRATVKMTAQNGRTHDFRSELKATGCKAKKK